MITLDDLVVLAMIAIAAGFLARRIWHRLRPPAKSATGSGCAGCSGCGGQAPRARPCDSGPAGWRERGRSGQDT